MNAAVILAAGASRRLGRPKQLVTVDGEPLVRHIARIALATCDYVVVIEGAVPLRRALAELPVFLVDNRGWDEGVASSIRAGIRAVSHCDKALLLTCDQLELDRAHIARLLAQDTLAASHYDGVLGIPAVFPARWYPQLLELTGDRGAQQLLGDAVAVDWPAGAHDLDVPAQLPHAASLRR